MGNKLSRNALMIGKQLSLCINSVPPQIDCDSKLLQPINLKAGATIMLPVIVTGIPDPAVQWFYSDSQLVSKENVAIETNKTKSTLSIKSSSKRNSGIYKVIGQNAAGQAEQEFSVTILGQFFSLICLFASLTCWFSSLTCWFFSLTCWFFSLTCWFFSLTSWFSSLICWFASLICWFSSLMCQFSLICQFSFYICHSPL